MTPIILCGGSGTRLWPLSRSQFPKQFLSLFEDDLSLFQQTVQRIAQRDNFNQIVCLTNSEHRFIVAHQLRAINVEAHIILEPSARNTAAAIAVATQFVLENDELDNTLLVMPADHHVEDENVFHTAIQSAREIARQDQIITFGIKPTHPETGYGYIKCAEPLSPHALTIKCFVEKPDLPTAEHYLQQKNYFWNAGIFVFDANTMLTQMQHHIPEILGVATQSLTEQTIDLDFVCLSDTFNQAQNISIDYAIMEKISNGALIPLDAGWSDVGSFNSVSDFFPKDKDNNTTVGEVINVDGKNNFIYGNNRLIGTLGLQNTIVVDTQDSLLVTTKDQAQNIGEIIKVLKSKNDERAHLHSQVHRPWGWYETIIEGEKFKVKRINVYPGGCLSLQKHRYRSEHWIVVTGTAVVHCDHEIFELFINQSTFIPRGSIHRLENKQSQDLQIIEVQNGTYLGEDDIVRLEDKYHRD